MSNGRYQKVPSLTKYISLQNIQWVLAKTGLVAENIFEMFPLYPEIST